jgi:hypothetical protein
MFNTHTNTVIDMHQPTTGMINPIDIACGLGNICRWGGQIRNYYSVAQHCVLASRMAPEPLKKAALLHDAAEAYLGDCISPLKHILGAAYKDIEHRFEEVIFQKFNVNIALLKEVKPIDIKLLELEHQAFRYSQMTEWDAIMAIYFGPMTTNCWPPAYARQMYMNEFCRLFNSESIEKGVYND